MRSGADIARINGLMGTYPWIYRTLRSLETLDGETRPVARRRRGA